MRNFMRNVTDFLGMILILSLARIVLTILGVFNLFWDWLIVSLDVWIYRISCFGVILFALLVAFMGGSFIYQSTNSPDQATVVVICVIGLFMVFAAVFFAVKLMPRGVNERYFNPYAR